MKSGNIRDIFAVCVGLLLVACLAPSAAAASDCPADHCYSVAEARSELGALFTTMVSEDVNFFARRGEDEYRAELEALQTRIDTPVTDAQLHLLLQEMLAFGQVGHAQTDIAVQDALGAIRSGARIIPLSIQYRGDQMLTDEWADTGDALPPGSRILSVAGMSVPQLETRARTVISADTDRMLRAQLELGMPIYLRILLGDVASAEVAFLKPDGTTAAHRIQALDLAAMRSLQQTRPVAAAGPGDPPRHFEAMPGGVFYLRPGPFMAIAGEGGDDPDTYASAAFAEFVEQAFAALAQSGAQDLLIDLRDNPGGDVSFSDLIISRIADRPYRFASFYQVRAGANTKAAWLGRGDNPDADPLVRLIARGIAETETGELFTVDLPEVEPRGDGRFDGKVWLLIDRHSFSNASVVAATVQDYGFGIILGEETADLPTTYGAVETFTLSHTQVVVHYPKAFMVRPSGLRDVHGVRPDFPIAPTAIGSADDVMLQTALAEITARR